MYDHGGAEPAASLSLLRPVIVTHYVAVAWRKEQRVTLELSVSLGAMTVLYPVGRSPRPRFQRTLRFPRPQVPRAAPKRALDVSARGWNLFRGYQDASPELPRVLGVNSIILVESIRLTIRSITNEACRGIIWNVNDICIDLSFPACLNVATSIGQLSQYIKISLPRRVYRESWKSNEVETVANLDADV